MHFRAASAIAGLALVAAACGGCSAEPKSLLEKAEESGRLAIGVRPDQPGLGQRQGEHAYVGFEVDVATQVAERLGVPATGLSFVPITQYGGTALTEQKVDMIVAGYTGSDPDSTGIAFSKPYLDTEIGLLTRADDEKIKDIDTARGKKICQVGTLTADLPGGIVVMETDSESECLVRLLDKKVDAVVGTDAELAGYAAQNPGRMRLVRTGTAAGGYVIAFRSDDDDTADEINGVLDRIGKDGTWAASLSRHLPELSKAQNLASP